MAAREIHKFILTDDGTIKFDFMTSLQNIVAAKIVNYLWMNKSRDIVKFIHSGIGPGYREFSDSWKQIKNNIAERISALLLSKSVSEKLNNIRGIAGHCILNWIRYHECIFNTNRYSAVNQINNIAWTARGKIDYAQTARNILADKYANLCDDEKYKLACTYCLEDEIAVLAPRVVNECYLNTVQIHKHPMVHFWTAHITGDSTEICNHYNDYIKSNNISINEYIMKLIIDSDKKSYSTLNEVPIRYMWGLLSKDEKAKNVSLFIKVLSNRELRYTFLSDLDFEQQQEVFKECSNSILSDLFNDRCWDGYFLPTALHILHIMTPDGYSFILNLVKEEVIKKIEEDNHFLYKKHCYIFKKLWQEGPKDLKDSVTNVNNGYSFKKFLFQLLEKGDMHVTEILLKDLKAKQKRDIILSYSGICCYAGFIMNDEWDFFEKFIRSNTLSSESSVNILKKVVIKWRGRKIVAHFLKNGEFDKIEHFMKWAFKSEKEMDTFRQSLAFINCEATLETVLSSKDIDFKSLENHFKWCAKGDVEVINEFKMKIAKSHSDELLRKLIEDDKYELLDKFLNWCFLDDPIKISQFKSCMYKDANLEDFCLSLTTFLIQKDSSFQLLNKFVDWLFPNPQEIEEYKMWLLGDEQEVYTDFWIQPDLADKFIRWCVTSAE